jgi:hypothetical protein
MTDERGTMREVTASAAPDVHPGLPVHSGLPTARAFPWFAYVLLGLLSAFTVFMGLALTY